jgi:serine phosphatase RsbU (regulator of sigma subunit)/HAMP domain-containing protein
VKFKVSLKIKIILAFVLLVILMMATVTYTFTIRELALRVEQVKLRMERLANNIATIRSVEADDWAIYQTYIDHQVKLNPDIIYISIVDEIGEMKAHALNIDWIEWESDRRPNKFEQAEMIQQLERRQISPESQRDFESKSVNILIGQQNLGTVNVGFSLVELNDEMHSNLVRNFELGFFFIVVAIVFAFLFSLKVVRPLGKLTQAMQQVAEGDFEQEIQIESRDEIGEMALTFNSMMKGLREKELIENFGRDLAFTIELEKITALITRQITRALDAKMGILFLRDKGQRHDFRLVHLEPRRNVDRLNLECPNALCQFFHDSPAPQRLDAFQAFPEFTRQILAIPVSANQVIVSPIIVKEQVVGIFILFYKHSEFFATENKFLSTLIGQGGFAIENALLLEELTQQEQMKRELEIARTVQQSLLPQQQLQIAGLELDGICIPATEVGGDYYDFFLLNDHTLGIAIADVVGKGTSAAFYMAMVKGSMLSLTRLFQSPRALLIELNRQLYGKMDRKVFITMMYAIVDLQEKLFFLARAGHNSLLMKSGTKGNVQCLTPKGIGIGLDAGPVFDKMVEEQAIPITSGDRFVFYTDGISEAMNHQREEFGEERLTALIQTLQHEPAVATRQKIIAEIETYVKNEPRHDDMTMINLRIL